MPEEAGGRGFVWKSVSERSGEEAVDKASNVPPGLRNSLILCPSAEALG
jgi:hypothetical protein